MSESGAPETQALTVRGDDIVVGEWSVEMGKVIAANVQLRGLLREGRTDEARALFQSRCAEEQAALIAVDAHPEELLSLTGMDEAGRPGYLSAVVDRLPSAVLIELLVPRDAKLMRFNTEVLARMSPSTFRRTVEDTLDPIYYHGTRCAVSWEWMEIVAALPDVNKAARLLLAVDEDVLEDALLTHVDRFEMNEVIAPGVAAFKTLGESGEGVMLPLFSDPERADVVHALHQAAPELISRVIRNTWERAGMAQR